MKPDLRSSIGKGGGRVELAVADALGAPPAGGEAAPEAPAPPPMSEPTPFAALTAGAASAWVEVPLAGEAVVGEAEVRS
jgi:hypothetical protein